VDRQAFDYDEQYGDLAKTSWHGFASKELHPEPHGEIMSVFPWQSSRFAVRNNVGVPAIKGTGIALVQAPEDAYHRRVSEAPVTLSFWHSSYHPGASSHEAIQSSEGRSGT
jgi:hypothetical protein